MMVAMRLRVFRWPRVLSFFGGTIFGGFASALFFLM
jgi:hypothetical protein